MKTAPFGHAIHLSIVRHSHMGWDPADRNVFAARVKDGQEALYFQDQRHGGCITSRGPEGHYGNPSRCHKEKTV